METGNCKNFGFMKPFQTLKNAQLYSFLFQKSGHCKIKSFKTRKHPLCQPVLYCVLFRRIVFKALLNYRRTRLLVSANVTFCFSHFCSWSCQVIRLFLSVMFCLDLKRCMTHLSLNGVISSCNSWSHTIGQHAVSTDLQIIMDPPPKKKNPITQRGWL